MAGFWMHQVGVVGVVAIARPGSQVIIRRISQNIDTDFVDLVGVERGSDAPNDRSEQYF